MRKLKNKQPNKKYYSLGDHVGFRITEKSGATQELVDFINKFVRPNGNFSAEIIECIKLRMDIERNYTMAQIEQLRSGGTQGSGAYLTDVVKGIEPKSNVKNESVFNKTMQEDHAATWENSQIDTKNAEDILFDENIFDTSIDDTQKSHTIQESTSTSRPGVKTLSSLRNLKKMGK